MNRLACIVGIAAGFCGSPAVAVDLEPHTRAKAIAATAATPALSASPTPARINLPDLHGGLDMDGRLLSGACGEKAAEVCYDARSGRLVYKGSRHWMPEISGLKAEHISVRRNRVELRYSFR